MDAIREVGPGNHCLGSDYSSYEQWSQEGGLTAARRAHAFYRKMLDEYVNPRL
jgi:trimethylamine:corrinoid methyltransferase-like protein